MKTRTLITNIFINISKHRNKVVIVSFFLGLTHLIYMLTLSHGDLLNQVLSDIYQAKIYRSNIYFYAPGSLYDHPNPNRIYFHESAKRARLNERQSCAVEAAAKHNPDKPVQVFMLRKEKFDYSSVWIKALSNYQNIEIVLVKEEEYFKGSPLEQWFQKGEWRLSPYKHVHLSDYLRMLSAFKGGGLYLDLDMVTLRQYGPDMKNFFVIELDNDQLVCNSAFHLESNNRFIKEIIYNISNDYRLLDWGHHGGTLISDLMKEYCGFKQIEKDRIINKCNDVRIFPYYSFLPLKPEEYDLMFSVPTNYSISLFNNSYAVHMWNTRMHHEFLDMNSDQLFSYLAREHCPLTAKHWAKCGRDKK